ncbi:hypothetical protein [Photobacterium sanctipauli]|uniref:hypothetical protein n=1 Tax=Photobacterium sanctipauli TaxID=1342794 RepID=UPI0013048F57|nr:hypothetical protein [Photobacterium sanctipauli]
MKAHITVKGLKHRFKVIKSQEGYYLYRRKFYFIWVSDGENYPTKYAAVGEIPY